MDKSKTLKEQREKIVKGLELTYQKLVEFKKSKNSPLIVSKNGKVIAVKPEQVQPKTIYKWK
jgi:sulfur carrier protein ThiS